VATLNGARENPVRMSEKMASWLSGSSASFMSIAAVYGSPRVHAEARALFQSQGIPPTSGQPIGWLYVAVTLDLLQAPGGWPG
jgi:hypothetical protein